MCTSDAHGRNGVNGDRPRPPITIRRETAADRAAIDELHLAAFRDPQLPPLIAAIRASEWWIPDLALVAERENRVIGHIIVSGTTLGADDGRTIPILMLSPLGVAPDEQNAGVGTALTRAALERADLRDEPLMIVQGHPTYYPRFGFVRGRAIGVLPPEHLGEIDMAWMARRRPGAEPVRGRVAYPPAFLELD
jgi:putative acetyltransferase